jgi:acyl dehydratase
MKPAQVVPEKCIGYSSKPGFTSVTTKESILYALGIGFSQDPLKTEDFTFTYELNDEFKVFPTYAVCLCSQNLNFFEVLLDCPGLPQFNPMMLLHGEQRVEFFKPIPVDSKLKSVGSIINVADKGKGALITFEIKTYEVAENNTENLLFVNQISVFIRGIGGFNYKGLPQKGLPAKPKRSPDALVDEKTTSNQAIIYRLSGDTNPLHIDPNMAAMGGFDRPILHGLCFFGLASKAVYQKYCVENVNAIKAVQARFTSHVFPGETVRFSLWKEGNTVVFSGSTVERGLECIVGSVELNETPSAKL